MTIYQSIHEHARQKNKTYRKIPFEERFEYVHPPQQAITEIGIGNRILYNRADRRGAKQVRLAGANAKCYLPVNQCGHCQWASQCSGGKR